MTPTFTFSAVLQEEGGGTFVEVPPDIVAALGTRKRPAIRVVINAVELQTTIAVYGGRSFIGIRRDIREATQVAPGERIAVSLELDDEPRTVDVPADLAAALTADPEARRIFDTLSFTNRKEYAQWVLSAKRPTTRANRVAETCGLLKSGRRTPGT